jgi:hypothetical protein
MDRRPDGQIGEGPRLGEFGRDRLQQAAARRDPVDARLDFSRRHRAILSKVATKSCRLAAVPLKNLDSPNFYLAVSIEINGLASKKFGNRFSLQIA